MTLVIRRIRWPDDADAIGLVDASFSTEIIYHVESLGLSFSLEEEAVFPALQKSVVVLNLAMEIRSLDRSVVAEINGEICGVAAMEYQSWNNRANLRHLYVAGHERRKGIGLQLLESMLNDAREMQARCLWVETQNTNYPAIQFYLRCGFRLCGLDQSL